MNSFKTSFGDTIAYIDGHEPTDAPPSLSQYYYHTEEKKEGDADASVDYQRHVKGNKIKTAIRIFREGGFGAISRRISRYIQENSVSPIVFNENYINDRFEYGMMIDLLRQWGVDTDWDRAIDVGTADGYAPMLLKGEGRCRHAIGVDVEKRNPPDATKLMSKSARVFKYPTHRLELNELVMRNAGAFGYYPKRSGTMWNIKIDKDPALDDYIVGDYLTVDHQADFISALLCIDYFDLDALFDKVASALRDGGVFCCLLNYWWWPTNSTRIVGHFPYATQRLTPEDFRSYVETAFPDDVDNIWKRYSYYHKGARPTVNDYIDMAYARGLAPIGYQRLTPRLRFQDRVTLTPWGMDEISDVDLEEVIANIHRFRTDVRMIDLRTAYVFMAFTKRKMNVTNSERHFSEKRRIVSS